MKYQLHNKVMSDNNTEKSNKIILMIYRMQATL